ncbi:MAG TPA: sugar ABC transporter permease, partial [Bacteroidales bacterium]|nr:sugar ABC transporter permease [Bacteroidales bacterium]
MDMPNCLQKRSLSVSLKKMLPMLLMIMPTVVFYFIFSYIPMFGIVIAFKEMDFVNGIWASPWVGFRNFEYLFVGKKIFSVATNTLAYNLVFMAVNTTLSMTAAIFLAEIKARFFKRVTQSVLLLPFFISWVIVGTFIYGIFHYEYGSLNSFLVSIGLERVNVHTKIWLWKYILVASSAWKSVGYG